jgi:hypothetical protein
LVYIEAENGTQTKQAGVSVIQRLSSENPKYRASVSAMMHYCGGRVHRTRRVYKRKPTGTAHPLEI